MKNQIKGIEKAIEDYLKTDLNMFPYNNHLIIICPVIFLVLSRSLTNYILHD